MLLNHKYENILILKKIHTQFGNFIVFVYLYIRKHFADSVFILTGHLLHSQVFL